MICRGDQLRKKKCANSHNSFAGGLQKSLRPMFKLDVDVDVDAGMGCILSHIGDTLVVRLRKF